MRIAIGSLVQQTTATVNPDTPATQRLTTMDGFTRNGLRRDAALLDGAGRTVLAGFLSVLAEVGMTPVPLLAADGGAGGPVMRETFHVLLTEMVHRLAARLPVDGVLLVLDSAMAIEDEPDAAAEILERVRNVLPPATPIGVALGACPRVTAQMRQPAVLFPEELEGPHPDTVEAGRRTARRLLDVLSGRPTAPEHASAKA